MPVYDFSLYAKRRDERHAAKAVVEVVADINRPGSVIELKLRFSEWLELHREVRKTA